MPEQKEIVINTGPLIALVAATGDLEILRGLYSRVIVPYEVREEILAGGESGFAVPEFLNATFPLPPNRFVSTLRLTSS